MKNSRRAFTLIEVLIVIAIIAILAALIFPSFSAAREDARQKSCSSNLREIGLAVQMYRAEEKEFPMSLGALLPPSKSPTPAVAPVATAYAPKLDNSNLTTFVGDATNPNNACGLDNTCPNSGGTGYLRDTEYLSCPDDRITSTQPRSSYGDLSTGIPAFPLPTTLPTSAEDLSRRVWNFWGYRIDGVTYNNQTAAQTGNGANVQPPPAAPNVYLFNPIQKYVAPDTTYDPILRPNPEDYRTNVVKNSLSNRFAPAGTIITYCSFHRVYSSGVSDGFRLYDPADTSDKAGARDLILRLDGTVKSVIVSAWNTATATDPNYQMWQKQTFR